MPRRLTKQQQERRERWVAVHLPRVRQVQRPNAAYITQAPVLAVLQHLVDAVAQLLISRPLSPFPWLADYLRHACKVGHCIEQDAAVVLMAEMHKKRQVVENALLDTKADEVESKRLIRQIIEQQNMLVLPPEEHVLTPEDHEFLATEPRRDQSVWSINTDVITLPIHEQAQRSVDEWAEGHLHPQRQVELYVNTVMSGVIQALVEMELTAPENPAEWMVLHFKRCEYKCQSIQEKEDTTSTRDPQLMLFFKTNYELMRKVERIKYDQREMHLRREALATMHSQLQEELHTRQWFIDKLRVANLTTRTHAIMEGTPVFLNSQKQWILPGCLLRPQALTPLEQQALERAERFVMEEDEVRWRVLLLSQQRYDAATRIRATWKCSRDYRVYEATKAKRRQAATIIQRNYFHYLYHRAISLPAWCEVGREVMVANSVAQKCAITFQFYPMKDFPTGNYRRLEGLSTDALMEIGREDEQCAGFSTDGALKRFIPRKLSQLKPMAEPSDGRSLTRNDGIYVKIYPPQSAQIVRTGIVTAIPDDRFGLITVVLDGICMTERVPLQKLYDRWKKIRIRRHRQEKKRKAFVFGGRTIVEADLDPGSAIQPGEYDVLDEDSDDEEATRRRRERRVRVQANEAGAEDTLLDFIFEDQLTKEVRGCEPHRTFADAGEREATIAKRKREYEEARAREYDKRKLESVVRLQCAWRSKRAREAFRQVLLLRAKEKERERLVSAAHHTNQQKNEARKAGAKQGFFGRWRRR